jgi:hypothetical protein
MAEKMNLAIDVAASWFARHLQTARRSAVRVVSENLDPKNLKSVDFLD